MTQFKAWFNENSEIIFLGVTIVFAVCVFFYALYVLKNTFIAKRANDIEKMRKMDVLITKRLSMTKAEFFTDEELMNERYCRVIIRCKTMMVGALCIIACIIGVMIL